MITALGELVDAVKTVLVLFTTESFPVNVTVDRFLSVDLIVTV